MRIILVLILLVPSLCFAQLSATDKDYGNLLVDWYGGNIKGVDGVNKERVKEYVYGDEKEKEEYSKAFVRDVLLVEALKIKLDIEKRLIEVEAEITKYQGYIK